jgi:hypothetical protein
MNTASNIDCSYYFISTSNFTFVYGNEARKKRTQVLAETHFFVYFHDITFYVLFLERSSFVIV